MDADVIEIVTDPFAGDHAMRALWLAAWGDEGPASFEPILSRSLVHVGAFDGPALVGFVNVAWDGGVHAFLLDTCVDQQYRRRGIALRLVAQAIAETRLRGARWLHVDYEPHLERLYQRCGFGPTAAGLIAL